MTDQPTPKRDFQAVVLDVDGTLLNSKVELSERNEKTIKAALEKGVQVILATGKTFHACKPIIDKLGIKTPGIYTQGITVYDSKGTITHQQTLNPDVARKVITFAEDRGFAMVAFAQGRVLAKTSNPYIAELHDVYHDPEPEYIGPLQNILGDIRINKLLALSAGDERKVKALRWQLSTQIDGNARLMGAGIGHMLEILPPGASKGNTLRALLKEMKIDPEKVLAIGDAENDLEMLRVVGWGVAMGNASKEVKEVANETTLSNDSDGVAVTIEKYITGPLEATTPTVVETPPASSEETAAPKPEDVLSGDETSS